MVRSLEATSVFDGKFVDVECLLISEAGFSYFGQYMQPVIKTPVNYDIMCTLTHIVAS